MKPVRTILILAALFASTSGCKKCMNCSVSNVKTITVPYALGMKVGDKITTTTDAGELCGEKLRHFKGKTFDNYDLFGNVSTSTWNCQ